MTTAVESQVQAGAATGVSTTFQAGQPKGKAKDQ